MKTHYSVTELLELELDGLPKSQKGLDKFLTRNNWKYKEVPSRGKGGVRREYEPNDNFKNLIISKVLKSRNLTATVELETGLIETNPSQPIQSANQLSNWQREIAENRLFIVRFLQQQVNHGTRITRTIEQLIADATNRSLPPELQEAVLKANAKSGDNRVVSRRTLFDWFGSVEFAEGKNISAISVLAPKERAKKDIPDWAEALLTLYRRPQKPTLAACLEFLPSYYSGEQPSYTQARNFIQKLGAVEREKGRMGSRDIKNIKAFIRRDSKDLLPADVYTADGHCFDAEVAHPMHGKPFRPEITAILDVASRKMVGWSVSLSESSWAVLDAIRMCATLHGIPAIFYVDNGSGYKNDLLTAQGRGVLSRLNITVSHALPYNSQGKGLIERSHKTLWVNAAKTLPTYIGKDMDAEASQTVHKITRKDIIEFGESKALISWSDFMELAANVVALYNNKPHRSLKRITDPMTMKKRHQTPNEAWSEHGELPVHIVQDWDAEDMFRPYEERKVLRCEIRLFSNIYFSKLLEEYHNDTVLVGYDIHDADKITVRNLDGQFICHAMWDANRRDYFPKPVIEQAREKRAQGRLDRLAVKQREVMEELNPRRVIEHIEQQTVIPFPNRQLRSNAEILAEIEALPVKQVEEFKPKYALPVDEMEAVPIVSIDEQIGKWMSLDQAILAGESVNDSDKEFWGAFQLSKKFKRLCNEDQQLQQHLKETEQLRSAIGL
jgi:putative transposase